MLKEHNVELTNLRSEKIESFVEILLVDTIDYKGASKINLSNFTTSKESQTDPIF